ncbi:TonB-dependent receptor domain-containing protein [Sulfurovum sp.]|uniref:TonB-dependent receptor plug domain-containing protein n=1 Tax=Sulfurovum sp. TaxID=1969726 RepID=UPI002867FFF0|nr:TonB-dependent receptor [Sulfurovum sp.]
MNIKSLSLVTATLLLTNTYADETLEPIIIVSSNKTTQSITNTTSNVTVITAEDIEENGYQTVSQAISTVAGISISQSGGLGQLTSIFTRGMNGGQTLVLLDGMRLNDPSTPNGAALIETFSTQNIERIEIIKGAQSSIWGSNASAGVINIITKSPKESVHGSLALGYGSYATKDMEAQLSYKDEKFMAQVMAAKLSTDGISAMAPRSAEADGYENENYNLKAGYTFNANNQLSLSYNDIKTDTQFDGSGPDDTKTAGDSKQKNYALTYDFTQNNYAGVFNASKSDIKRRYMSLDDWGGAYSSLNEATMNEYSFINKLNYDENTAILGLEYKDIDGLFDGTYTSPYYSSYDPRDTGYTNKAVFVSNVYHLNDATFFETNLRYDTFDKFENKATYKLGATHRLSLLEGLSASANYYTAYDAPSIYQLAKQSPVVNELKPMYTKGYDISASYKDLFSITYFNNEVEDNIVDVGWYPDAQYVNIEGKEKFKGIELQGNYALPVAGVTLSGNYTRLLDYKNIEDKNLIRRPKEVLNLSLDKYTDSNTHWGINTQYIGDREDTRFNPDWTTSQVSTGNYTLWNLNFGTKIIDDIDLSIHARNIFDKDYQSVYGYATEGRSAYAKIKYSF